MKAQRQSKSRFVVALVVVLLVTGLAFAAHNRPSVLASGPGKDSLAEASQGLADAYAAKDPTRISSYFASEVIAMYPLDSVPTVGYDANYQRWVQAFQIMEAHPITSDTVVSANSKDVGYSFGRFCGIGIQGVGDLCGRYVATWKWTESGWKITVLSAHVHQDVLPSDVTGQ
ncbi:MAG TPA: nuclear transport factor 2 family protein [Anaerolineales bacterium]|nr:nuclear transport factor 2 family protein [Anaerolineales bacterium]